ncbi:gamma-aminobutyric acid receptor subunit beta-2-like [Branchiostoma floridae x Branchiostoma japonicum]
MTAPLKHTACLLRLVVVTGLLFVWWRPCEGNAPNKTVCVLYEASPNISCLLEGYDRNFRPNFGKEALVINMSMTVASIDSVSEVDLDYTITILLRQFWKDQRLAYRGMNRSLSLDGRLVEALWVPDTFLLNSKEAFLHRVTVDNRLIRLFPDGELIYGMRITSVLACKMDLRKYPLDEQTCTLELESYGYTKEDLIFTWKNGNKSIHNLDKIDLSQFSLGDHNTMTAESVYETGTYPRLVLSFKLHRNVFFFLLQTYVPSILLVISSWVSFWINHEAVPARVALGITTVLTMTTFITSARASLPRISYIKAVDVYLVMCFVFVFAALLEYAFVNFESTTSKHRARKRLRARKNKNKKQEEVKVLGEAKPLKGALKTAVTESNKTDDDSPTSPGVGSTASSTRRRGAERQQTTFFDVASNVVSNLREKRAAFKVEIKDINVIDKYSRIIFPLSFVLFNIFYWITYTF